MKINILFIIIVLSYSCNTISESEKLEEYGEYLDQFESYEYDVSQQMYQYATDKTSRRSATAYFSEDPNDSILEIDYYIALEANGSSYISFYNEGIETSLNLNDSMAYTKHLSLYPANKRMTNPIAIYSFHSIKKWIEKNSRDSTFKNLVLKDTIIDGKKCDLFSYNIDFKEHAYWYNFPKKTVNRTVNSVNIAFSKESQLPVYLSCRENFSSKNYIVEKSWFSNFHQTHYNKQKLSEESVPNYFHWYNGGNMLPLNSILPNFILPTLTGDSITLSDIRGKYVLIEFSYIGCGPCIKSIPKLNNIQNMYADKNFKIYGINLYCSNPKKISEYKINRGIEYDILWSDTDFFAKYYLVTSAPTIYLIDDYGRNIYSSIGFKEDELRAKLKDIFGT